MARQWFAWPLSYGLIPFLRALRWARQWLQRRARRTPVAEAAGVFAFGVLERKFRERSSVQSSPIGEETEGRKANMRVARSGLT